MESTRQMTICRIEFFPSNLESPSQSICHHASSFSFWMTFNVHQSHSMFLFRTTIHSARNKACGSNFGLSFVDSLPHEFVQLVKHGTELHQFPHQSGLPVLQIDPDHGCGVGCSQEDLFLCGILLCILRLFGACVLCRGRMEPCPILPPHRARLCVVKCVCRRCPSECPRATL